MARRHPVRSKRPAQQPLSDDVFIEKTLVATSWARQNRQALTLGAIGIAVLLAGALYYVSYRSDRLEQASVELERVRQNVAVGDTAAAAVELAQYLDAFGGTPYAGEASLLLGELYLASGRPAEAADVLEEAADPSDPLGLQALLLQAKAHEQMGQLDQAEALFLRAADRADLDFQVHQALDDAARIRESRGDPAGAAELYERILEEMSDEAPERAVYEMRLAEARAATG